MFLGRKAAVPTITFGQCYDLVCLFLIEEERRPERLVDDPLNEMRKHLAFDTIDLRDMAGDLNDYFNDRGIKLDLEPGDLTSPPNLTVEGTVMVVWRNIPPAQRAVP